MFIKSLKCLAFAIAVTPLAGCAGAVGTIFSSFLRAMAYSPDMEDALFSQAMLGFALVETFMVVVLVIIGLIFAF